MELYFKVGFFLVELYVAYWVVIGCYNLLLVAKSFISDSDYVGYTPAWVLRVGNSKNSFFKEATSDESLFFLVPLVLSTFYLPIALCLICYGILLMLRSICRLQKGVKKLNEHKHLKGKVVFKKDSE